MGPTASGKTALAIQLTQQLPCDIISVDSALVYRGLDIGTAKPDAETLRLAPHRLLGIRDPSEAYSVGQFRTDALREIADITAHDRIPLLVGGTMLYFRALQKGLAELPQADQKIRARLSHDAETLGLQALHHRLQNIDPVAAARIHPNDPQRIQRALEVYELTGQTLTALCEKSADELLHYKIINIALAPQDRQVLHNNIALRFQQMLEQGFVAEVEKLYKRGDLNPDLPALRAVGYRQVWDYLAGKYSYDDMRDRAIIATRQLAKRQLTWLRSWENIHWIDSEDPQRLERILKLVR